jgi:hypothetical protein
LVSLYFLPSHYKIVAGNDADMEIGQYSCAGRQLALMELRLAIVLVALNFDLSLAPGEDGVKFDQGAKDTFTLTLSGLQVVLQERPRV